MYVRTRGRRLELIRPIYDKERKRSVDTFIGSIDLRGPLKLVDDLRTKLTDVEINIVRAHLDVLNAERRRQYAQLTLDGLDVNLDQIVEAVMIGEINDEQIEKVLQAMQKVKRAIRNRGYKIKGVTATKK